MKAVVDTNVLVSAMFFGGTPGRILELWRDDKLKLAVSPEIVSEYEQVSQRLAIRYPAVNPALLVGLIVQNAEVVPDVPLADRVCADRPTTSFSLVRSQVAQAPLSAVTSNCWPYRDIGT